LSFDIENLGINIENLSFDIETVGIDIENLSFDIEAASIDIETVGIDIEAASIDIENLSLDKHRLSPKEYSPVIHEAAVSMSRVPQAHRAPAANLSPPPAYLL